MSYPKVNLNIRILLERLSFEMCLPENVFTHKLTHPLVVSQLRKDVALIKKRKENNEKDEKIYFKLFCSKPDLFFFYNDGSFSQN